MSEKDKPITGNSLEHEWLRYVDKEKKESGGELPYLGEYGWLMIAGHFANWQKEQMMKDAVEGEIGYWNQRGLSIRLDQSLERLGYGEDTKVKIIIVKED